jgi:mannitol/fructose-specific phosphotransferase system IIA component (Ntr-type)
MVHIEYLQKPYDPMVFLRTAADAKKARHHLARMTETCNQLMSLNGLQKPYDPMVFLCTAGDAKKARHCLMIQGIAHKASTNISMIFLSLSTESDIIFYFEMNRTWLLPCLLLPRMHLARSCLNGLQKPYEPMVFLCTAADAKKARHHLVRMTETCNQLMSSHMKCKSDLLPTGHI